MIAYWLSEYETAQPEALKAEGLFWDHVAPENADEYFQKLMAERGYVLKDEVVLDQDYPDYATLSDLFSREHSHEEDEVRYVKDGGGVFDVRTRDDRWIRIVVGVGDLIIVPAKRNHRFLLSPPQHEHTLIHSVRMFKSDSGWKANVRI